MDEIYLFVRLGQKWEDDTARTLNYSPNASNYVALQHSLTKKMRKSRKPFITADLIGNLFLSFSDNKPGVVKPLSESGTSRERDVAKESNECFSELGVRGVSVQFPPSNRVRRHFQNPGHIRLRQPTIKTNLSQLVA